MNLCVQPFDTCHFGLWDWVHLDALKLATVPSSIADDVCPDAGNHNCVCSYSVVLRVILSLLLWMLLWGWLFAWFYTTRRAIQARNHAHCEALHARALFTR